VVSKSKAQCESPFKLHLRKRPVLTYLLNFSKLFCRVNLVIPFCVNLAFLLPPAAVLFTTIFSRVLFL